jgi:uncharacterized Tic20 family protein
MSDSPVDKAISFLKFEDAPPFGGGTMPVDKEKTFVLLAHIFSLIIWLWKRKESPAVDAHGKEALNFGITYVICVMIPMYILTMILPISLLMILNILLMILGLAVLALVIYGGLKAQEGKLLRYPINFRLIK